MFAKYVLQYLKAHLAAIITAGYLLDADLQSVHYHFGDINPNQWYVLVSAFAVAFGLVAAVSNTPVVDVPTAPVVVDAPQDTVSA